MHGSQPSSKISASSILGYQSHTNRTFAASITIIMPKIDAYWYIIPLIPIYYTLILELYLLKGSLTVFMSRIHSWGSTAYEKGRIPWPNFRIFSLSDNSFGSIC
jgi:hypothetical protein